MKQTEQTVRLEEQDFLNGNTHFEERLLMALLPNKKFKALCLQSLNSFLNKEEVAMKREGVTSEDVRFFLFTSKGDLDSRVAQLSQESFVGEVTKFTAQVSCEETIQFFLAPFVEIVSQSELRIVILSE